MPPTVPPGAQTPPASPRGLKDQRELLAVAGVAALVVSKGLRGQAAVQRILSTASDAGPPGPDAEYGAGIVNARRAVTGLGFGQAGGGSGGSSTSVSVSVRRKQRIRTVLRRGIRVRCRASGAGRCRVAASVRKRRVASGSKRLRAGRSAVVTARLNRRGRRVARRALRARRRVAVRLRVTLPGAPPQHRRVTLLPK